ncbi:mitochondrial pseudouridine synthase Rsu [Andalucia godoyi]|uniref:Mitochondrial pseudouridine synthase Rsu n=1 Tax=Andalucia godoyi TaxID=505711 RepID=A0A8K0AI08_ANDGO|nr:mitochondrial pseudouridine synthase Rsu [Andalucia godoyi]|eukprot:ANDGO_07968.mRNA.1 mitochondrial pseudouridine synthase Rsu
MFGYFRCCRACFATNVVSRESAAPRLFMHNKKQGVIVGNPNPNFDAALSPSLPSPSSLSLSLSLLSGARSTEKKKPPRSKKEKKPFEFLLPHLERMPGLPAGLMPVGRLDANSEGLLLLTTDGKLKQSIERSDLPREYRVKVHALGVSHKGGVLPDALARMEKYAKAGVPAFSPRPSRAKKGRLASIIIPPQHQDASVSSGIGDFGGVEEATTANANKKQQREKEEGLFLYRPFGFHVEKAGSGATNAWVRITLAEGRNREVRNLCERAGLGVVRLIREKFGPYRLGQLEKGAVFEVDTKLMLQALARESTPS